MWPSGRKVFFGARDRSSITRVASEILSQKWSPVYGVSRPLIKKLAHRFGNYTSREKNRIQHFNTNVKKPVPALCRL